MKKIGLAVCYDTKNFGSQLQVLATVKEIESLGFETEIIRYKKKLTPKFLVQSIPRVFNPYFISGKRNGRKKKKEIQAYPKIAEKVAVRNKRFDSFVNQYFSNILSDPYNGWENLVSGVSDVYDAFLCGSDQLWLPSNLGSHFYTLEFAPDKKNKIAYATSFGVSEIPLYQKKRTAKYLKRFQFLSTREIAGSKIIEELTGKPAKVVCDPTLLFDSEQWMRLIPDKKIIDEPYVFCYFLGTNMDHRKAAEAFRQKTRLKLVTCPFLDNFVEYDREFGDIQLFDMDAADFVNLIRHAEYVLTDSFHGTVFSILNHKRFLTFNRFTEGVNSRNSRIDSLCELLGLKARRYAGRIDSVEDDIDFLTVDSKLIKLRSSSEKFLEDALSDI